MSDLLNPLTLEEETTLATALKTPEGAVVEVVPLSAAEEDELVTLQLLHDDQHDATTEARLTELETRQAAYFDNGGDGVSPTPVKDPSIRELVSGSGTITRFRVSAGRKQIIEELIPIRVRSVIEGETRYRRNGVEVTKEEFESAEPQIGDDATTEFHRIEKLGPAILAGDPEAVAKGEKLGLVPIVKWYRRVQPDRRKQHDSEAAAANPPPRGDAATVATGELAAESYALTRRNLIGTASRVAVGGAEPPAPGVLVESMTFGQRQDDEDRTRHQAKVTELAEAVEAELELPTETVG